MAAQAIFGVNVRGVFLWLREALPALKASNGPSQLVVTSSTAALKGFANGGPCARRLERSRARTFAGVQAPN